MVLPGNRYYPGHLPLTLLRQAVAEAPQGESCRTSALSRMGPSIGLYYTWSGDEQSEQNSGLLPEHRLFPSPKLHRRPGAAGLDGYRLLDIEPENLPGLDFAAPLAE